MQTILITLLATFFIQFGYLLWKIAAKDLPDMQQSSKLLLIKALLKNIPWLAGVIATTLGWILFIRATSIGAISLVQPLMSVGDVFLVIMAIVFLKEKVTKFEFGGILVIILGAIILSVHEEKAHPESLQLFSAIIFIAITLVFVALLYKFKPSFVSLEINLATIVGVGFGLGAILTKLMTIYAGAQAGLLHYIVNPFLPLVILSNCLGIYFLQVAFQKGRASIIVPFQLSVVNFIAVFFGILILGESPSPAKLIGTTIIICGSVLLQKKQVV